MMKPTRIAAMWLAVVFLAGALFGFVANTFYSQRTARASTSNPRESRERFVARLQKDLALTPEQLAQVRAIMDQTGQRFREVREKMDRDSQTIREEHRQQILAILTPEQQPKYKQILEERRRRHEKAAAQSGPR